MDVVKRKRVKPKPKLQRRNAMKNIDYHIPSSLASSFDDSSSPDFQSPPSLDKQTSIRVQGVDGEFDLIFRSLGLSGPDDLSIPISDWEAQRSRYNLGDRSPEKKAEDEKLEKLGGFESRVSIKRDFSENCDDGKIGRSGVSSDLKPVCGGGIKGVRPPVLSTPPVKLPPVVDDGRSLSTWDLVRSLSGAVIDNESPISDGGVSSCGEENGGGGGEGESHGVRHGEGNVVSDEESDVVGEKDSGEVDESFYSVSPHGSFRRVFKSWQKGEILGKGSFGTVYEGFTE